jgi:hypothetical protein
LFPTTGWVYAWRIPKEADNPEGLDTTVKHGSRSVMIWAASVFCWSYNYSEWSHYCQWVCGQFR